MILYAESSAVLAWLLNEPGAPAVLQQLRAAERVCTSSLTGVECARALTRALQMGRLSRVEELAASQLLATAEAGWDLFAMTDAVLVRARAPLPNDPVRTLDALHLATALGKECVAEGIEHEGQLASLLELGCSAGQGYLFSAPLPAAELGELLRSTTR